MKIIAIIDLIGLAGLLTLFVMAIRPKYNSFLIPIIGSVVLWLFFAFLIIRVWIYL